MTTNDSVKPSKVYVGSFRKYYVNIVSSASTLHLQVIHLIYFCMFILFPIMAAIRNSLSECRKSTISCLSSGVCWDICQEILDENERSDTGYEGIKMSNSSSDISVYE